MTFVRPLSPQPLPKNAKRVFKGVIFDVYQWRQKMFDGSIETFEKLKRSDIVNVLPIVNGKVVLTQQEQPGGRPFIGVLGGRIDKNETPLQAAERELMEESGLKAEKFVLWYAVNPFPKIDCAIYTFIAKNCVKVSGQKLDSGEKIKLISVTFDQFVKLTADQRYRDWEISLKIFRVTQNPAEFQKIKTLFTN
jgi:8-oxo-dGTP pyrophosphatase MutT (NUDIX family)